MLINNIKNLKAYTVNVNDKIETKVAMRNQAKMDRMCYLKVHEWMGGETIQTVAFKSFTCCALQLFNRASPGNSL